jgi:hypothetical protein
MFDKIQASADFGGEAEFLVFLPFIHRQWLDRQRDKHC